VTITAKILLFAALCWVVYAGLTDPVMLKYEPGMTPDKVIGSAVMLIAGGFLIFTWKKKP